MTHLTPTQAISPAHTDIALRSAAVIGFALATAAAAKVMIPLPGTPVPMTLQTLAVPLAALALGPRLGAISMALYLLMGLCLGPFFADPTQYGLGVLLGATGGYLLGFVLAQPVINSLARRSRPDAPPAPAPWPRMAAGVLAGYAVIFACGLAWLYVFMSLTTPGYTPADALRQGLLPFLAGDLIKAATAALLAPPLVAFSTGRRW